MADFKPELNAEVTFEGTTYRWLGGAWGIVNPKTGKAGRSANKEIAEKLNALLAPKEEVTEAKKETEISTPILQDTGKKDYGSGTRLAQLYRKATDEGAGTFGGIATATKERLKEKLDPRNAFGSGLMGAVGEKVFGKGYNALKQPSNITGSVSPAPEGIGGEQLGEIGNDISILTKNSMTWAGMSRDVNVIRQNVIKITNGVLQKGKSKVEGKDDSKKAATGADMYFLKADEREAALESERQRLKSKEKSNTSPIKGSEKSSDGGGFNIKDFIGNIINWVKDGLFKALRFIFKPSNLLKTLGKVFVIGTLIASLVNGLIDGWKAWQETGDLKEAIIAGLGGIVDFLTFGLFDKESIRTLFNTVGEYINPVIDSISKVVTTIKDWVVNNVGIPEIKLPTIPAIGFTIPAISVDLPAMLGGKKITIFDGLEVKKGPWELGSIGPWYPFKSNPKSAAPEVSAQPEKKEVSPAAAADKAVDAAAKKESTESKPEKTTPATPADIGKEQEQTPTKQSTESVAAVEQKMPTKMDLVGEKDKSLVEQASYYEKKRDETISLVRKIKKAKEKAIADGAPPEKIAEIDNDITTALIAAGDFERMRVQTLAKAGEKPVPVNTVSKELEQQVSQTPEQKGAAGNINDRLTKLFGMGAGGPTRQAMESAGAEMGAAKSPAEQLKTFGKVASDMGMNQAPSLVASLSDTDAKSVFTEGGGASPTSASSPSAIPESAAITPSGGESSSTATPSASSGGGESSSAASLAATPSTVSEPSSSATSGSDLSLASAEVAEQQRLEMSANEPTVINNNSSTSNNTATSDDKKETASVVDEVFAEMVMA